MSFKYLPNEEMWSDALTKPLQVNSYIVMRINLMNITDIYVDLGENAPAKGRKT